MRALKKLFNAFTLVQLVYCTGAVIALAFLGLEKADITNFLSSVSIALALICCIPWGLYGTVFNIVVLCITDIKKSKRAVIWTVAAPILVVLCWLVAAGVLGYWGQGV